MHEFFFLCLWFVFFVHIYSSLFLSINSVGKVYMHRPSICEQNERRRIVGARRGTMTSPCCGQPLHHDGGLCSVSSQKVLCNSFLLVAPVGTYGSYRLAFQGYGVLLPFLARQAALIVKITKFEFLKTCMPYI
jgi:hypothetical protein